MIMKAGMEMTSRKKITWILRFRQNHLKKPTFPPLCFFPELPFRSEELILMVWLVNVNFGAYLHGLVHSFQVIVAHPDTTMCNR